MAGIPARRPYENDKSPIESPCGDVACLTVGNAGILACCYASGEHLGGTGEIETRSVSVLLRFAGVKVIFK